jgi:cold shock protein
MKFFSTVKGFGFVQPDDGSKDVFVPATALKAAGIRSLNEGDRSASSSKTTGAAAASKL